MFNFHMTGDHGRMSNCTVNAKLSETIAKKTERRFFSNTASTNHAQNSNREVTT